jgi:hypothetical protein
MYPYNFKRGQTIQSDVPGVAADHAFLAHLNFTAAQAVAASNTGVHAAVTLTASAQTVTTAITNPGVPRALIIKGNAAGIAGNVVVTGKNFKDETITETIALDGASAVEGTKAFKSVTSIALPAKTNASGDTVSVGWCDKLGLPYMLAHNTVLLAALDNAREATAPTVTVDADEIEKNTVKLSSALAGAAVDIYLIV